MDHEVYFPGDGADRLRGAWNCV